MNARRFDPLSLFAGLLFVVLGSWFLIRPDASASWVAPIVMIVLGAGWMLKGPRQR